jgi:aarF domain-containing kinase
MDACCRRGRGWCGPRLCLEPIKFAAHVIVSPIIAKLASSLFDLGRLCRTSDSSLSSWASAVRGVTAGVPRFVSSVSTAAVIGADYKIVKQWAKWQGVEEASDEYKEMERRLHVRSAERILNLSLRLGGIWMKLSQYVSTLRPAVPVEYTSVLAAAQDKANSRPFEEIRLVIEEELGAPPEELFAYFEREPVAAASIAQVHRAVAKDGERVAVKVQYPSIRDQVKADAAAIRVSVAFVGWRASTGVVGLQVITWFWGKLYPKYDLQWLLPEFEESILWELDFRQEAVTTERMGRMLSSAQDRASMRVHVPAIRWDLTAERVMGMEWIDGVKPTRLDDIRAMKIDPKDVAGVACRAFADMIHVHGLVHTDPHPGNVLVRWVPRDGPRARRRDLGVWSEASAPGADDRRARGEWQLVVLDHGMYRRLAPSFRQGYCKLWEAMLLRDEALGRDAAVQLGLKGDAYDALSLMLTYRTGKRASKEELQQTMKRMSKASPEQIQQFMMDLPRDFFFVSRTTNLVRGLNLELGGTTAERIRAFGDSAVRGIALNDDVHGVREVLSIGATDAPPIGWWWQLYSDLGLGDSSKRPTFPYGRLNEPTDSELAAWLRTRNGARYLSECAARAAAAPVASAQSVLYAERRRGETPQSHMNTFVGSMASVFGSSAAEAAGLMDATGPDEAAEAAVAAAVGAASEAGGRLAQRGSLSEALRSWSAWWAVLRVRATLSVLDAGMWLMLLWRSVLAGNGFQVDDNWGEFGGKRKGGDWAGPGANETEEKGDAWTAPRADETEQEALHRKQREQRLQKMDQLQHG